MLGGGGLLLLLLLLFVCRNVDGLCLCLRRPVRGGRLFLVLSRSLSLSRLLVAHDLVAYES